MSRRDDRALIRDMLDAARSAVAAVEGLDFTGFSKDHVRALGLVKCLEIFGEAASRLSEEVRVQNPAIPWAVIVAMRNRLVHAYFAIDYEQVWMTLTQDLPPLVERLEALDEAGEV